MKFNVTAEGRTFARLPWAQSPWWRFGFALLVSGLAAAIDFLFPNFGAHDPLLPFYLSTAVAAWFGGFRAGLLAAVAALACVDYYFIPPPGFGVSGMGLVQLIVAGFIMGAIAWLITFGAWSSEEIQSQRKESEDQRRRQQAILSSAAKIAGMGSWEYDVVNDRLEWDDETIGIFGITREAFGKNLAAFFELIHPDDRETLKAMQVAAWASHGITEMEYRIVRPDGAVRQVHDRGQVTRNEAGKPVRSAGMIMDVTDRRRAEQALRASEERWRAIFENSPVGIALADEKGFFASTNRAFQELVGFTEQELRTLTFLDITWEDDRVANQDLTRQLWQGKLPWFQHEKRYRRKDGNLIWVRNTVSLAPGTEMAPRVGMAIVENITERRSLEEQVRQSQRMEAVGRLAGGVAHDFNNMLGVILGHCMGLQESLPVGSPEWQSVRQIKEASTRSADLTRQLLAFSRKQILLPRVLDLNVTVDELSSMLESLTGDDIELVIRPGSEVGCVKADPGQIGQVVMNLVVNARDAMPHGGKVVIATENVILDGQLADNFVIVPGPYVMLSVTDNGCGIGAEILNHIFEPFFTTKEQGQGTGLGLAMVYGIVKQSDGYIVAESQPGTGTTFKIYLPRAEGKPDTTVTELEGASPEGGGEAILLAEDEPLLSEIVRLQLQSAGYTVLEAHNGKEALEIAQNHAGSIDLLLTDVLMSGGMNGLELAASLVSMRPGLKVLYMTGYTADVIDAKGVSNLQGNILQKPFSAVSLRHKIREVLIQPMAAEK
ncbi:MAG: PAS domain S-box protein [Candidatus Angelobacter sp.]